MTHEDGWRLVALETAHIQPYIFETNKLREQVGASYLVAVATQEWAFECLYDVVGDGGNVVQQHGTYRLNIDESRRIEEDALKAEVLYAGGGKWFALFRHATDAKAFLKKHSQKVILEAPGLHVLHASVAFDWSHSLSDTVRDLTRILTEQRNDYPSTIGMLGLGVTAQGSSTSMPVTTIQYVDKAFQAYAAETNAKRDHSIKANDRLKSLLPHTDYDFPNEFEDIVQSENDMSYLAVIHADGNDMGNSITAIAQQYADRGGDANRAYIQEMRAFSEALKGIAQEAMQRTVALLTPQGNQWATRDTDPLFLQGTDHSFVPSKRTRQRYLPLRPLISGGDDMTFVCDGAYGVFLAAEYLRFFEEASQKYLGQVYTACAGVAMVKPHYPFSRAYELSEDLCQSAKQQRRQDDRLDDLNSSASSAIDWYFTTGGLYGDIDAMRQREYREQSGEHPLNLRPLYVTHTKSQHDVFTWNYLE